MGRGLHYFHDFFPEDEEDPETTKCKNNRRGNKGSAGASCRPMENTARKPRKQKRRLSRAPLLGEPFNWDDLFNLGAPDDPEPSQSDARNTSREYLLARSVINGYQTGCYGVFDKRRQFSQRKSYGYQGNLGRRLPNNVDVGRHEPHLDINRNRRNDTGIHGNNGLYSNTGANNSQTGSGSRSNPRGVSSRPTANLVTTRNKPNDSIRRNALENAAHNSYYGNQALHPGYYSNNRPNPNNETQNKPVHHGNQIINSGNHSNNTSSNILQNIQHCDVTDPRTSVGNPSNADGNPQNSAASLYCNSVYLPPINGVPVQPGLNPGHHYYNNSSLAMGHYYYPSNSSLATGLQYFPSNSNLTTMSSSTSWSSCSLCFCDSSLHISLRCRQCQNAFLSSPAAWNMRRSVLAPSSSDSQDSELAPPSVAWSVDSGTFHNPTPPPNMPTPPPPYEQALSAPERVHRIELNNEVQYMSLVFKTN